MVEAAHNSISHGKYRPEIDGLRAIAVISVVLFHAGMDSIPGGFIGVDIFFVISGYLITKIITYELDHEKFSIIKFYERRARRILPALLTVLFVTIAFAALISIPSQFDLSLKSAIAAILSVSNVYFWMQTGYFAPASELNPLLHTWSLGVEEQFYIFYPLILVLLHNFRINIRYALIFFTIIGFLISLWLSYNKTSFAFYMIPARAWELSLGGGTGSIVNSSV